MCSKAKFKVGKLNNKDLNLLADNHEYMMACYHSHGLVTYLSDINMRKQSILPYSLSIKLDGEIIGMIAIELCSLEGEPYYDLFVYIKPEFRNKGVMTYLCYGKDKLFKKFEKNCDRNLPLLTSLRKDANHESLLEFFDLKLISDNDDYYVYQIVS